MQEVARKLSSFRHKVQRFWRLRKEVAQGGDDQDDGDDTGMCVSECVHVCMYACGSVCV